MNNNTKPNYLVPLLFIGFFFFLLGFSLGINGLLIPYLKKAFSLSSTSSYLILSASFSAFVILGYPSGLVIQKFGYKKSISISFLIFAFGLYLFIPSAKHESFLLFLLASFISGAANTLLQAAINPYITILGPVESAARRISFMIIFNRSGWAIAPIFLALFLDLSQINVTLTDLYMPFYIIVFVFLLLSVLTRFAPLPEIKALGEDEENSTSESIQTRNYVATKKNVFQFPHLVLGMIALFFFVGVDTLTLVAPVDFAARLGLENPERYTMHTVLAVVFGCVLGIILIPKYISQHKILKIGSLLGTFLSLLIVVLPPSIAIHLIALTGFSISLVWGAVWPLSIAHLGKFTKIGSSVLVMAIVGGAVYPLIFAWLADELMDMQKAFCVFTPALLFITFYAFRGYKVGLPDNAD